MTRALPCFSKLAKRANMENVLHQINNHTQAISAIGPTHSTTNPQHH